MAAKLSLIKNGFRAEVDPQAPPRMYIVELASIRDEQIARSLNTTRQRITSLRRCEPDVWAALDRDHTMSVMRAMEGESPLCPISHDQEPAKHDISNRTLGLLASFCLLCLLLVGRLTFDFTSVGIVAIGAYAHWATPRRRA